LGHEVIFLVGDYTARVGDPDKDIARKMLTVEEIEKNCAGWKDQAKQLIDFEGDNPVQFKHNYDWLHKLNLTDLIKLMSQATVQQMMERDLFDRRLKKQDPIGLQEFIYPLMQGYDSVAMEVDIEIGGTDQIFNMLVGRNLVKAYLGKDKFVRANILMDAPDGRTMSKTKGNGINLGDTSENMYGKAMSYPDELIVKGLTLLTEIDLKQIAEIEHEIKDGANPMTYKKLMAYEIVKTIRGETEAKRAQEYFEKTVQNKEVGESDMRETSLTGIMPIFEFLKGTDLGRTNSQIKEVIKQGGVEVNGKRVDDINEQIDFTSGTVIKFGKREYIKVK
jgi:tyrosyl-tRNA synthetase